MLLPNLRGKKRRTYMDVEGSSLRKDKNENINTEQKI